MNDDPDGSLVLSLIKHDMDPFEISDVRPMPQYFI